MNTAAHDAVNIPKGPSGGPRTEQGKANSSRNAIRTGLYAARDFIRPGEEEEYAQSLIKLMDELTPEGTLEQTFATEIMGATWRLRRCRLVEEAFGTVDDLDFDPMMDERTEKTQKSVDRARAQSHLILRRSIGELAKLQKARFLRGQNQDNSQPAPGPAPAGFDALMALADKQLAPSDPIRTESQSQTRDQWSSSFCNPEPPTPPSMGSYCKTTVGPASDLPSSPKNDSDLIRTEAQPRTSASWSDSSFCKTAPTAAPAPKQTPRNAQCPCGSGQKYKRCCARREAGAAGSSVLKPGWEQQPAVNA